MTEHAETVTTRREIYDVATDARPRPTHYRRFRLKPCSLPIPTQNIFSSTHHIKSFDACMEH
jgi:hypothetical protein